MSSPEPNPSAEAEFDFAPFGFIDGASPTSRMKIDVGKFLLSIWKPLLLGGCLGGMIGIGVYLLLGPVYSANTQVLVSKKATVSTMDGEANRFGDRGDHVELIKSDMVIEPAFKNHGLKDVPELAEAYDPYKNIREGMSVSRSAGQEHSFDNVFDISFDHPDKEIAKTVVQAIVNSYRDYLTETRDENSKQLYQSLLKRQLDLGQEVADLETEYRKFRAEAPLFLKASPIVTAEGAVMPPQNRYESELNSIEEAQNQNQIQRTGIQAKLAELERRRSRGDSREALEFWVNYSLSTGTASSGKGQSAGGGADVLSGPPVKVDLDQQLMTARLLEQRLLHTLGEDHTVVRSVHRQIETILDAYRMQGLTPPTYRASSGNGEGSEAHVGMDLVSVYEDTLKGQLEELLVMAQNLDLMRKDAENKAKDAELYQVEDQRLKDAIAVKKKQLQQVFDQIAAYDMSREQEGYRMRQIAQVRIERSLKRVIKIVGAFGIFGVGIVFVLSYLREWMDTRIKTIDELRRLAKLPVIGSIPEFATGKKALQLATDPHVAASLVFHQRPKSREAEAFRNIRTTLFHGLAEDDVLLQITSTEPDDGKSMVIANTALAMGHAGKKVLLVDCDLRRPTIHELFHVSQDVGVTDVLGREIDWRNALKSTPNENLSILTSGRCPANPAEVLSHPELASMLKEMKSEFDYVLIDTPPLLAVSDAAIITPHVDGVIVVSKLFKNRRAPLSRALETLSQHGARVQGVIANGLTEQVADESGLGYDSYGHYFEADSPSAKTTSVTERQPLQNTTP